MELDLETLGERVLWRAFYASAAVPARPPARRLLARRLRARRLCARNLRAGKYVCVMLMEEQPQAAPSISFSSSRIREFFHPAQQYRRAGVLISRQMLLWSQRSHNLTFEAIPAILGIQPGTYLVG